MKLINKGERVMIIQLILLNIIMCLFGYLFLNSNNQELHITGWIIICTSLLLLIVETIIYLVREWRKENK